MLTGNLVLVKTVKQRVIPRYLNRESVQWLEMAESLLMIYREGIGRTRGEIQSEVDDLIGEGVATLVPRGLAKILDDRTEYEVVSELPPEKVRQQVFSAAAAHRRQLRAAGHRAPFRRDIVMQQVASELNVDADIVSSAMFADLKDENRMLRFDDMTAQALLDRYNVALAQAVLLRSVLLSAEVRGERPPRYRQLFRWLKFHRLLYRVEGSMSAGYQFQIDGPMSLFSSTTRYGLQIALFLPALLLCHDFRLDAELRWGPKREPRWFHLEAADGLVSHYRDTGQYTPAEILAFLERFRQIAPDWTVSDFSDVLELGPEAVWVPDYRFVHNPSGTDVFVEILGFWKKSSLDRLLRLLPQHGPPRYLLAVSDRLKVDESTLDDPNAPILRFKEIPNAPEFLARLESLLPPSSNLTLA